MKTKEKTVVPFTFTPGLNTDDPKAVYWLGQVTVRLRREICWLWYEQGVSPHEQPDHLPQFSDKTAAALGGQRSWEKKQQFFNNDPTARYLSEQLKTDNHEQKYAFSAEQKFNYRGFGWLVQVLSLKDVEAFVLALGLLTFFDSAAGNVIASCLNEPGRSQPTLSLAQRLWDNPEQVLDLTSPTNPLFHYGILHLDNHESNDHNIDWQAPLCIAPLVAEQLLFPQANSWRGLRLLTSDGRRHPSDPALFLAAARLAQNGNSHAQIIPLRGERGSAGEETVEAISAIRGKRVIQFDGDPALLKQRSYLHALAAFCWLNDTDLFLDQEQVRVLMGEKDGLELEQLPKVSIPIALYLGITERKQIGKIPQAYLLPVIDLQPLTYQERVELWTTCLGARAGQIRAAIEENARRFRLQKNTIKKIAGGLCLLEGPLSEKEITAACRAEVDLDMGDLAQRVIPRFYDEKLILPPKQTRQFREIVKAMQSLTQVHYEWGTEKVWNEGGISVLFAGPPGTGKTMAAEILAAELDLPMFRIDLSQVASKYIGDTEKNLKRLFDSADLSDTVLFFDEADALYGRRTEVKDAHDRYANLEISYLLERMERFKGLAILATNRKKDLDDAFLRRLRYIVDFPVPGEEERRRIWRQVIPRKVDGSLLDIGFLAQRFHLTGGHIRSIVFNACLQSAGRKHAVSEKYRGQLNMEQVVIAVKREYEKLNRTISIEQFGPYAGIIKKIEDENHADKD